MYEWSRFMKGKLLLCVLKLFTLSVLHKLEIIFNTDIAELQDMVFCQEKRNCPGSERDRVFYNVLYLLTSVVGNLFPDSRSHLSSIRIPKACPTTLALNWK